jgi:hypothetical protein
MTYLSVLDDSASEIIGGGFGLGDTNAIIGISLTSLRQSYKIIQKNDVANNVQTPASGSVLPFSWGGGSGGSGGSGGGSPFYAASVANYLQNIAIVG